MTFNNTPNKWHKVKDGRIIWESRSVAVNGVILIDVIDFDSPGPYALVSERGKNAADNIGLWNNVAGYLDYDESGTDALIRETWEEVGINISNMIEDAIQVYSVNIDQPWHVQTNPTDNNKQNVSLRYGLYTKQRWFPVLHADNNEIEGEVGKMKWVHIEDLHHYDWAWGHDQIIRSYYDFITRLPWAKR